MTAALLLRALVPLRPAVDGQELVLAGPPPGPLRLVVPALQTGVRAVLTGRPWYGIGPDGRGLGPLGDGALDPARPLPWAVRQMCVAGDNCWDVVPDGWRATLAHLFGPPPAKRPRTLVTNNRYCPYLPLVATDG